MDELLPCPFCGSNDLYVHLTKDDGGDSAVVECQGDGCYTVGQCPAMPKLSNIQKLEEAIRLWNRRTEANQPITVDAGVMVIGDTSGLHIVADSNGLRIYGGKKLLWQ